MLKNFKITIEYDGTAYHGWQRQADDRTIQGEIEKALMTITGNKVTLTGAGRTDAGVHAFGQVANFHCRTALDPGVFLKGLNSLLPKDIVITRCTQVSVKFHARYDAKSKSYHYRILNRDLPAAIFRQYAWHIRKRLNLDAMLNSLCYIIGTHDFKAFEGTGSPRANTIRSVMHADIEKMDDGYLVFKIQGNGFLRFMVRNIVGTFVDVGLGKITPRDINRVLVSKDRNLAGITAPAHGLFLMQVNY
ncbi:MAG: tRNA pseudouridine(38-40) synthase TruA [Thermodesulfobacteriota bacterium]|nr:tRNA pseudouridine(38-40) synthase TruA [Thermodesulfobacteriota bacterium]